MTINEIAKMAGVSRATVSRYLNHGYVSAANREKIGQIIKETGYVPSAPAQTLRSKRTNYIGVVIPKINSDSIAQMVSGIHRSLAGTSYHMLLACTGNHEEEEVKSLHVFKEDKVDGRDGIYGRTSQRTGRLQCAAGNPGPEYTRLPLRLFRRLSGGV